MLKTVLILNAIWFFGGFHIFYIRRNIFAKIIVPQDERDTPVFQTVVETGRFMGGFNFALFVLNVLLLFNLGLFDQNLQWAILLFVMAVAHGSQFVGNVPIALQNRRGEGVWDVFKGLMLLIFVVDFTLMMANGLLAAKYLLS
ncbi:MAG: hypothetical protein AAF431_14050 [Pseudomonadota bacterium]